MNEKLSLSELQRVIKDVLYMSLPDLYWVIAEIAEIKENFNGHCYLELVEKLPDDQNISARARGIIWSSRCSFIKSLFENTTGESLRPGIKILARVRIEYHEVYGLSLVIQDIDPSYTLGEMALKRQQILSRLAGEGIIDMNKELSFPVVPQRIAIISSKNAAGFTDFMKHLSENSYGYAFHTMLFDAPMQGTEAEKGILDALDRIAALVDKFDVVTIIRGGGSQADLSWFDNYNIAYYITQFPLPVLTGIGHEKDLTVTDLVAHKALKTPTAVADFLIEGMNSAEEMFMNLSSEITTLAQSILEKSRQEIENFRVKLIPVASLMISELKEQLSSMIIELINTGKDYINRAAVIPSGQRSRLASLPRSFLAVKSTDIVLKKQNLTKYSKGMISARLVKIEGLKNSLGMLDPSNVLKRGYTITSRGGKIIRSSSLLKEEDLIDTLFFDGKVSSNVTRVSGNRTLKSDI